MFSRSSPIQSIKMSLAHCGYAFTCYFSYSYSQVNTLPALCSWTPTTRSFISVLAFPTRASSFTSSNLCSWRRKEEQKGFQLYQNNNRITDYLSLSKVTWTILHLAIWFTIACFVSHDRCLVDLKCALNALRVTAMLESLIISLLHHLHFTLIAHSHLLTTHAAYHNLFWVSHFTHSNHYAILPSLASSHCISLQHPSIMHLSLPFPS